MKQLKLIASLIAMFLFISLGQAQIDLMNIESQDKGVLFPTMSTMDRDAIVDPKGGMIIFNSDTGKLNYHNDIVWTELVGTGGPYGATGPQGNTGIDIQGPDGPPGVDGIQCWDLNGDGNNDTNEDIDNNGLFNVNDCPGNPGPPGPKGLNNTTQGPVGALGFTGPRAGQVYTRQVVSPGITCIEFDEPTLNTREDFILLHQSRQKDTVFEVPNTHLSFQNGKWNVCANTSLVMNTFYDIIVIGN